MNHRIEAIDESIQHWMRMRDNAVEMIPICNWEERPVSADCELCAQYFNKAKCTHCPVKLFIGASLCAHTPYEWASRAFDYIYVCSHYEAEAYFRFVVAATAEIEFLQQVRLAEYAKAS